MDQDLTEELLDFIRSRYFGKYRGTVTKNSDDTSRGRLQVQVPAVLGDLKVWAMPCVAYAGKGVGFYSLPEPGTGVWVEFEGGDPAYPIWTGFFWADGELPDESDANIKIWKTESLTLRLDDTNDEILAEASSGSKVTIAADVVSESGGSTQTVGSSGVVSDGGGGKVEVSSVSVKINGDALVVTTDG
jgi:uncharacterized protein involved in type VI secretion and phage assembly